MRTAIGIEAHVANLAASGKSKRTGGRTSRLAGVASAGNVSGRVGDFRKGVLVQSCNRSEPERTRTILSNPGRERLVAYFVWTAWSGVRDLTAILKAWRPRKTAAPGESVAHLPTTNNVVHSTASVAQEPLTFADWQFVNRVGYKHVIAIVRVWTPSDGLVYVEVVRVVGVRMRERIVGEELESVASALFGLNLQRVIFVVGVVTEVTGVNGAAGQGHLRHHSVD